ncbi:MAG: TRAP transporter small permease subunit [Alphaproteobacteria bacterium]|nr:TRAP transporter small permease subunit [Alphaproteobacteria bacterium]
MSEGEGGGGGRVPGAAERAMARVMAVPRFVVAALILVSIAINFANVVGRYVFFSPIVWAEEAMIFIMIWCVFIGAVLVTWDGRHLRMDLLAAAIPSPWREAVNFIAAAGFLAVTGLVTVQSWEAVTLFAGLGQTSTTAGVPMVIPHSALLIGFALMFVCVAVRFRAHVAGTLGTEVADVVKDYVGGQGDGAPAPGGKDGAA